MKANTMNPDQTAPNGAVWTGFILFAIMATEVHKQMTIIMNGGKRVN